MLARSKPWRRPARHARDERALHLFLQVEDRVVRLRCAAPAERGELASRRRRASGALRQRRNATGITRRMRGSSATSGTKASSATQSIAGAGRVRLDVGHERQRVHDVAERRGSHHQQSAPLASAYVDASARCPPRGSNSRLGAARRRSCAAHRVNLPAHVRTASPVAHRDHPRRRPTSSRSALRRRRSPRKRSWSIRAAAMIP